MMLIRHGGGTITHGVSRIFATATPPSNPWPTMLQASGVTAKSLSDSTGMLEGLLQR
jgi:hypothetical protein